MNHELTKTQKPKRPTSRLEWKHQANNAQLKLIKTITQEVELATRHQREQTYKIKQEVTKWGLT